MEIVANKNIKKHMKSSSCAINPPHTHDNMHTRNLVRLLTPGDHAANLQLPARYYFMKLIPAMKNLH